VPAIRSIPRLSNIDFITPPVLQALGFAESLPSDPNDCDAQIFENAAVLTALQNQIREIVADYCADKAQQLAPNELKQFRSELRKFELQLERTIVLFPAIQAQSRVRDALADALDRQIEAMCDQERDLEGIHCDLADLLAAVKHLSKLEGVRGPKADRAKHQLIGGLARIFENHTAKDASKHWSIDPMKDGDEAVSGAFAEFVKAVNDSIPLGYRLTGLQNLFRPLAA
jgi:hypothetical protein